MKLGTAFKAGQIVNVVAAVAEALNEVTQSFPSLAVNKWVLIAQLFLGQFLPSAFGIAHRLAFGEAQAPADRTTTEVMQSAVVVKAALVAAAPMGTTVTVPTVNTVSMKGTGGS